MSEVQILALGKEVAQCVRDNGLPGFPDPYFENGQLRLPPVDANVEQQGQAALEGRCPYSALRHPYGHGDRVIDL